MTNDLSQTKLFTCNLEHPGRVNIFKFGTVKLYELPEAKLIEIYKAGNCPHLIPTQAGIKKFNPGMAIIKANQISGQKPDTKKGRTGQRRYKTDEKKYNSDKPKK